MPRTVYRARRRRPAARQHVPWEPRASRLPHTAPVHQRWLERMLVSLLDDGRGPRRGHGQHGGGGGGGGQRGGGAQRPGPQAGAGKQARHSWKHAICVGARQCVGGRAGDGCGAMRVGRRGTAAIGKCCGIMGACRGTAVTYHDINMLYARGRQMMCTSFQGGSTARRRSNSGKAIRRSSVQAAKSCAEWRMICPVATNANGTPK